MSLLFSSDGTGAFQRQADSPRRFAVERPLKVYYEVEKCTKFIQSDPSFTKVALQFPDSLLYDAGGVMDALQRSCAACADSRKDFYILGDTSYGSCCVDEVAAEHVGADCIIHFGPSCLTQTSRLPVLYVFGREPVDTGHCASCFRQLFPSPKAHVLVMYDTVYSHCADGLSEELSKEYKNLVVSSLMLPQVLQKKQTTLEDVHLTGMGLHGGYSTDASEASTHSEELKRKDGEFHRFGRYFRLSSPADVGLGEYQIFYVGSEGLALSSLMLSYNRNQFYSYNPETKSSRKEMTSINKALGRRYFLVQKAKEARTVGILVGTLGAANFMEVIKRLKEVIKLAGKRYYTFAMGKLNPAKLANFMEIDVFVLVACPQNSLLDSKEFHKPVITPFELEMACIRGLVWKGNYVTDYRELLPGGPYHHPLEREASECGEIEPEFSFINGGLIHFATSDETESGDTERQGAVVRKTNTELTSWSPAGSYMQSRSWKGLEQRLGECEPQKAVQGRSGIAAGYSHEQNHY